MKTFKLYRAQPTVPSDPVEGVTIVIDAELPEDVPFDAGKAAARFDEEAFALHYALKRSLPRGTMFRLAARLIEEVAGVVRVSADVLDPGRIPGCRLDAPGGESASCAPLVPPPNAAYAVAGRIQNGSIKVEEVIRHGAIVHRDKLFFPLIHVEGSRESRDPVPGDVLGIYHDGRGAFAVRPAR